MNFRFRNDVYDFYLNDMHFIVKDYSEYMDFWRTIYAKDIESLKTNIRKYFEERCGKRI